MATKVWFNKTGKRVWPTATDAARTLAYTISIADDPDSRLFPEVKLQPLVSVRGLAFSPRLLPHAC